MRRPARRLLLATGLIAPAAVFPPTAGAQTAPVPEPVAEELVVVESSVLLQRAARTRVENLAVSVDGAPAEAVAIYPLTEIEFPTTIYFDLCATSFSRLAHAVAMVATISEQLLDKGPVTVVAHDDTGHRPLLESSRDALSLEAALTVVLRAPLGECAPAVALADLARMRAALSGLGSASSAPGLLILYGFDHQAIGAEEIERFQPQFAAAGRDLTGRGRTLLVLAPDEGDTRLRQEEVRPQLGDPDGPPRTIDLGALLGALFSRKRMVPDDPRLLDLATDPRNELLRELVAPGHGRLFAFPRQLEAFVRDLSGYQILFYRSRLSESERQGNLAALEVRTRSGELVGTAMVTSRARTTPSGG